MRVALDSNILIYAEGYSDDTRNIDAQRIIAAIPAVDLVIPVQAVAETLAWLMRRAGLERPTASANVRRWLTAYTVQPSSIDVMEHALDLIAVHGLQVFDSIILASAYAAEAEVLLSEDMQHGFHWRGVTVINPFLAQPHPLMGRILGAT